MGRESFKQKEQCGSYESVRLSLSILTWIGLNEKARDTQEPGHTGPASCTRI
jgi:hypothetical protein